MEGSELLKFQLLLMKPDYKCNGFHAFYHEYFFNKTNNPEAKFSMADEIVEKWSHLSAEEKEEWAEKEEKLRSKYQAEKEHKTGKKSQHKPKATESKQHEDGVQDLQKSVKQMKISERKKEEEEHQHKHTDENNDDHNSAKRRGRPRKTEPVQENLDEEHQSAKRQPKGRKTEHDEARECSPEPVGKKSNLKSGMKSGCSKRRM